ncbi:MAG: MaoC family dehydratase [Pseudomonadota bacterium]
MSVELIASKRRRLEQGTLAVIRISSIDDASQWVGKCIGASSWHEIDQSRIDQFAEATGDRQWIHVDTERAAAQMPGGKTIAHGYLTLALIPALTSELVTFDNLARTINFGCDKVRFHSMVCCDDRVRIHTTIKSARKRGGALYLVSSHEIEVEGKRKPACSTDTIGMYFFAP